MVSNLFSKFNEFSSGIISLVVPKEPPASFYLEDNAGRTMNLNLKQPDDLDTNYELIVLAVIHVSLVTTLLAEANIFRNIQTKLYTKIKHNLTFWRLVQLPTEELLDKYKSFVMLVSTTWHPAEIAAHCLFYAFNWSKHEPEDQLNAQLNYPNLTFWQTAFVKLFEYSRRSSTQIHCYYNPTLFNRSIPNSIVSVTIKSNRAFVTT